MTVRLELDDSPLLLFKDLGQDYSPSQPQCLWKAVSILSAASSSQQHFGLVSEMSATRTSAASSGTSIVVTISSLAAQTTKIYNLLLVLFVFMIIAILFASIAFYILLKKRKTNQTASDSEHAIPLATLKSLPLPPSPKPAVPARDPRRPVMTPPTASSATPIRPTQTQRSQTAGPPLPLKDRPVLRKNQTHGADYSSGRPRRYGSTHLSQSGPSVSANVHNSSATEAFGSRKMDKIYNS